MKTLNAKIQVMQAFDAGARLECCHSGRSVWIETRNPSWNWDECDYRIKPEPKLRPWRPEEVPVGALIRWTHNNDSRSVILGITTELGSQKIQWAGNTTFSAIGLEEAAIAFEYSLDHGKTWQPCGVPE